MAVRVTMRSAVLVALLAVCCTAEVTLVDDIRNHFYTLEEKLWKNISRVNWSSILPAPPSALLQDILTFDDVIKCIPSFSDVGVDDWLWSRVLDEIQIVDGFYRSFIQFTREQVQTGANPATEHQLMSLAHAILFEEDTSMVQLINILEEVLGDGGLFRNISKEENLCKLQMSPHQLIYHMYETISLTEIKGYIMMQFSWMLLRIYGKAYAERERKINRLRFVNSSFGIATAARFAMNSASRAVYQCDPDKHTPGNTYAEISGLLQGYIENEVDMNEDGSCREDCAYYSSAKLHGCYKNEFCSKQRKCEGRILNCHYFESDMWVCPAVSVNGSALRRYSFIEYEDGPIFGKVDSCAQGKIQVESWWRGFYHCSYCMCLCEETLSLSERTFSLREALADAEHNKVVTGIRIVKHGKVFHLQVSEGQLGERGYVTPGNWVPVQKFAVTDAAVREGVDYHTLTYKKRAVDLDELDSPIGHVLTGVRFNVSGAHLYLEICSTPFNYTTGRLSAEGSQWIRYKDVKRSKLALVRPNIPTRSSVPLRVDSKHDQYVEFTHSDFESDVAQSTVPFIDIQPLEPVKGSALLSGAGLLHRGARGSGGFVGVKLLAYDQSQYISALPPDIEDETDIQNSYSFK